MGLQGPVAAECKFIFLRASLEIGANWIKSWDCINAHQTSDTSVFLVDNLLASHRVHPLRYSHSHLRPYSLSREPFQLAQLEME